jgi:hypothetical protein
MVKRLKNVEHFADFMLWAWATAESDIDLMFLEQFDVDYFDTTSQESRDFYEKAGLTEFVDRDAKKARLLLRSSISAKYEFLKSVGVFNADEKPIIKRLIDDRVSLFHGDLWRPTVLGRNEAERVEIMNNAHKAVDIIFNWTLKVIFRDFENPPKAEDYVDIPTLDSIMKSADIA